MSGIKKKAISIETKLKVIKALGTGVRRSDVSKMFGLVNFSVGSIWNARDQIKKAETHKDLKKIKKPTHEDLDQALIIWFSQQRTLNLVVSGPILKIKTGKLAGKLGIETSNVQTVGLTVGRRGTT